jgi:hypothetical protein
LAKGWLDEHWPSRFCLAISWKGKLAWPKIWAGVEVCAFLGPPLRSRFQHFFIPFPKYISFGVGSLPFRARSSESTTGREKTNPQSPHILTISNPFELHFAGFFDGLQSQSALL